MTCQETKHLLNAYVDGELDSEGSLSVESHVEGCASCSTGVAGLRALSSAIEKGGLRFTAPVRLKTNVQSAIRAASPRARHSFFHWRWASVAAAAVLAIGLTWIVAGHYSQSSQQTQLVREIVSNHVRSMMANHLTDVASSDSHTVKPWFGGKLDYSPPAKDLTEQGFRLIGGRLDYLENRPVAAIVYQRSMHFINLFVWPSSSAAMNEENERAIQGYNVIHWTKSGMTYWLISELNQAELEECARLLRE